MTHFLSRLKRRPQPTTTDTEAAPTKALRSYDPSKRQVIEPQLATLGFELPESPDDPGFPAFVRKVSEQNPALATSVQGMVIDERTMHASKILQESEQRARQAAKPREVMQKILFTENARGEKVVNKNVILGAAAVLGASVMIGMMFTNTTPTTTELASTQNGTPTPTVTGTTPQEAAPSTGGTPGATATDATGVPPAPESGTTAAGGIAPQPSSGYDATSAAPPPPTAYAPSGYEPTPPTQPGSGYATGAPSTGYANSGSSSGYDSSADTGSDTAPATTYAPPSSQTYTPSAPETNAGYAPTSAVSVQPQGTAGGPGGAPGGAAPRPPAPPVQFSVTNGKPTPTGTSGQAQGSQGSAGVVAYRRPAESGSFVKYQAGGAPQGSASQQSGGTQQAGAVQPASQGQANAPQANGTAPTGMVVYRSVQPAAAPNVVYRATSEAGQSGTSSAPQAANGTPYAPASDTPLKVSAPQGTVTSAAAVLYRRPAPAPVAQPTQPTQAAQTTQNAPGTTEADVPFTLGQRMKARLETALLTAEGASSMPIYARTTDGTLWRGLVKLDATKRVIVLFDRAVLPDGREVPVRASAYGMDGRPGLVAQYHDVAPTLIPDLLRSTLTGVKNYADALINQKKVTVTNNFATQENVPPNFLTTVAGSAASVFQLPANRQTFVTVAEIALGAEFAIIYGPVGEQDGR